MISLLPYFPPITLSLKVEIIEWSNGEKINTGGKNIIYFPPVEILSLDIVTKKDCVQREKYDLISLLQYFPPSTQSVRVEKLLHGLRGKK